jgi:hypothetical protein
MPLQFRLMPTAGTTQARVDREARIIRGVSVLQTGEALGHNMLVDEVMLNQCAQAINANSGGMKSRFTHPGACSDAMGKMLGKVRDAKVMGDKVIADLHLADHASKTPEGDLAEYVMSLAEESPTDFGLSIAFDGAAVWRDLAGKEFPTANENGDRAPRPVDATTDKPLARISKLRAADVVDEPAANRDGLFAAFAGTTQADAAQMFAALDQARDAMGWDARKTTDFLSRYLAARKPKDTHMDPTAFAALIDANPAHAAPLAKLFAAGKSEPEITAALVELKRDGETAQLRADLAAAKSAQERDATALAALQKAHAEQGSKLAKLSALGLSAIDPGANPVTDAAPNSPAAVDQAWAAMPAPERAAFMNDLEVYRWHVAHSGK